MLVDIIYPLWSTSFSFFKLRSLNTARQTSGKCNMHFWAMWINSAYLLRACCVLGTEWIKANSGDQPQSPGICILTGEIWLARPLSLAKPNHLIYIHLALLLSMNCKNTENASCLYLYFQQLAENNYAGASQVVLVVKNPSAHAGDIKDMGLISGLGQSPGGGHGNPLQCFCLETPMDTGAWWLWSIGSQRVGHDWSDLTCTYIHRYVLD